MNNKKVNWLFLCIILVNYALLLLLLVLAFQGKMLNIGIVGNLFLAQAIMLAPALIFAVTSYIDMKRTAVMQSPWTMPPYAEMPGTGTETVSFNELLGFHKIKISTVFMVILFAFLLMPLTSALNSISMLFVDNAVNAISDEILKMPFLVMWFMIGVFAPFSEEFIFRGVIFRGYKNSASVLQAVVWSAVLFGIMHLNFNQAPYAIAMGIMCALVVEASGSLWASIITHMIFNTPSVCIMYLAEFIKPGYYTDGNLEEAVTNEELIALIGPELVMAVIATSLAVCVLVWIAKNENRQEHLRGIIARRKMDKGHIVSIPLIIALVLGFIYICINS